MQQEEENHGLNSNHIVIVAHTTGLNTACTLKQWDEMIRSLSRDGGVYHIHQCFFFSKTSLDCKSTREKITEAYQFIVEHFTVTPATRVWMVGDGLVVRTLLGMIECCGVIKASFDDIFHVGRGFVDPSRINLSLSFRCYEILGIYERSFTDSEFTSRGGYTQVFRLGNSHLMKDRRIVSFAGMIDGVNDGFFKKVHKITKILLGRDHENPLHLSSPCQSIVKHACRVQGGYCFSSETQKWVHPPSFFLCSNTPSTSSFEWIIQELLGALSRTSS